MSSSRILFAECGHCGTTLQVKTHKTEKVLACPKCQAQVYVSTTAPVSIAPSEPAPPEQAAAVPGATAVIQSFQSARESSGVFWRRRLYAVVASGIVHVFVIAVFVVTLRELARDPDAPMPSLDTTVVDMPEERGEEFFDVAPDLSPASDVPLDALFVQAQPAGLPDRDDPFVPGTADPIANELIGPARNGDHEFDELSRTGRNGNLGLPAAVQERLNKAGGKSGQVQITLIWNNRNDLDLHCRDPNGEWINYTNQRAMKGSEGHLDVDANVAGETTSPIENIYFPEGKAPAGKYQVYVNHFSPHGSRDPTYYQVYVKVNDKRLSFRGSISAGQPMRLIHEFTMPAPRK